MDSPSFIAAYQVPTRRRFRWPLRGSLWALAVVLIATLLIGPTRDWVFDVVVNYRKMIESQKRYRQLNASLIPAGTVVWKHVVQLDEQGWSIERPDVEIRDPVNRWWNSLDSPWPELSGVLLDDRPYIFASERATDTGSAMIVVGGPTHSGLQQSGDEFLNLRFYRWIPRWTGFPRFRCTLQRDQVSRSLLLLRFKPRQEQHFPTVIAGEAPQTAPSVVRFPLIMDGKPESVQVDFGQSPTVVTCTFGHVDSRSTAMAVVEY